MKKNFIKPLSILSASIFLLNNNFGLLNNHVLAAPTLVSSQKQPNENNFMGDDGKVYKLGEYLGRGNQSFVYDCTDELGTKYVVKIPLDEFLGKDLDKDGQPMRKDVLEILSRPVAHRVSAEPYSRPIPPPTPRKAAPTALRSIPICNSPKVAKSKSCFIPPSTPHKKESKLLTGAPISPTRLNFNDDSDEDDDSTDSVISSILNSSSKENRLFSSSDYRDEFSKICSAPRSGNTNRKVKPIFSTSNVTLNQGTGCDKTPPQLCLSSPKKARSLPKPESFAMHSTVTDQSVAERLGDAPCTVKIFSYIPHIEEFLGQTLTQHLKQNRFPQTQTKFTEWARNILFDILSSLMHLHNRDIYHRDIKPDNIFVNKIGKAVVGDLGAARVSFDATRECVGTPGYMAPELLYSVMPRDPAKADVFGFGMTALDVLTDFDAKAYFKANESKREKEDIKSLINRLPLRVKDEHGNILHLPEKWKAFLYYCLNPNPAERATAKQALAELSRI